MAIRHYNLAGCNAKLRVKQCATASGLGTNCRPNVQEESFLASVWKQPSVLLAIGMPFMYRNLRGVCQTSFDGTGSYWRVFGEHVGT